MKAGLWALLAGLVASGAEAQTNAGMQRSEGALPFEMTREDLDGAQGTAVRFSLRRLDA